MPYDTFYDTACFPSVVFTINSLNDKWHTSMDSRFRKPEIEVKKCFYLLINAWRFGMLSFSVLIHLSQRLQFNF